MVGRPVRSRGRPARVPSPSPTSYHVDVADGRLRAVVPVLRRPGGAHPGADRAADPRAPDGGRRHRAGADPAVRRGRRRPDHGPPRERPGDCRGADADRRAGLCRRGGAAARDAGRGAGAISGPGRLRDAARHGDRGQGPGPVGPGLPAAAGGRPHAEGGWPRRCRACRRWRHPRRNRAAPAGGRRRDRGAGLARVRRPRPRRPDGWLHGLPEPAVAP